MTDNTMPTSTRAAFDAKERAREALATATGADSVAIRPDMGLAIVYASTRTVMLEARGTADGRRAYRVNNEWFGDAALAAAHATSRKIAKVAAAFEAAGALITAAIETESAYWAAYHAWREATTA